MAGISPTIGSAQHPMIRRRLRLAEVRMSALDGLTLLPFPRLPCDTNSRRGCIADTGRGIWPSSDVSIERSFFFFIFFYLVNPWKWIDRVYRDDLKRKNERRNF